jgi:hypothetical protein
LEFCAALLEVGSHIGKVWVAVHLIGLLLLHAILIVIEILTLQSNHVVSLLSQGL